MQFLTNPSKGVSAKTARVLEQGHAIFSRETYAVIKTAPDMLLGSGREEAPGHSPSSNYEARTFHQALGTVIYQVIRPGQTNSNPSAGRSGTSSLGSRRARGYK